MGKKSSYCDTAVTVFVQLQVGGATGHIGDPSGKTKEREAIDAETVERNILGLTENLDRIFLNHELFLWKDSKGRQLETVKYVIISSFSCTHFISL